MVASASSLRFAVECERSCRCKVSAAARSLSQSIASHSRAADVNEASPAAACSAAADLATEQVEPGQQPAPLAVASGRPARSCCGKARANRPWHRRTCHMLCFARRLRHCNHLPSALATAITRRLHSPLQSLAACCTRRCLQSLATRRLQSPLSAVATAISDSHVRRLARNCVSGSECSRQHGLRRQLSQSQAQSPSPL